MKATCLNCTLKRSPTESNTASLSEVVMSALRDDGDEWPQIREGILAAEIPTIPAQAWTYRNKGPGRATRSTRSRPHRRAETKEH